MSTPLPTQPIISICVSVYNIESYLEKCLDSVINQTLTNIEIIIVDDASTDNSEIIIQKYLKKDQRVRFIQHKSNLGANATRKTALTHAYGLYIIFIDGDDWIHTSMLSKLFEKSNNGTVDVVICKLLLIYGRHIRIPYVNLKKNKPISHTNHKKKILPTGINPGYTNKIWKTSLFSNPEIDFIHLPLGEDLVVTSKLFFYAQTVEFVDEPLYYYRLNHKKTSASIKHQEQKLLKCLEGEFILYNNLLAFFSKHNLHKEINKILAERKYWLYKYAEESSQLNSIPAKQLLIELLKKHHGKNSDYPINVTLLFWKAKFLGLLERWFPKKIFYLLMWLYIKYLK